MSYFSSLGRNRMGVFGRGVQIHWRSANMNLETERTEYPMSRSLQYSVIYRQPYESSCRRGCGGIRLLSRSGFPRILSFFPAYLRPALALGRRASAGAMRLPMYRKSLVSRTLVF